jgi:hypothetical protein
MVMETTLSALARMIRPLPLRLSVTTDRTMAMSLEISLGVPGLMT